MMITKYDLFLECQKYIFLNLKFWDYDELKGRYNQIYWKMTPLSTLLLRPGECCFINSFSSGLVWPKRQTNEWDAQR